MPKFSMTPWIQNEDGLSLIPARDANYTAPLQGLTELISQNELHVVTTAQRFPIGSLIYDVGSDSKYRYVEFGGTTAAGDMVQAEAPDGAHDDLSPDGDGTGAAMTKGSTIISIDESITLVENEYAGGFLYTEDSGTGAGYRYPIKSNEAGATTDLNITLWEPGLAVAVTGDTNVALIKSRYKEVIEAPSTLTGVPTGASLGIGANGSFGWVQTRGPAAVLVKGTILIGNNVVVVTTAGSVGPAPSDILPVVGWTMDVGADTKFGLIFLTLE
jgi:hypothetical protein